MNLIIRQRARELLSLPHMRLHLILAALCCLAFWIGGVYINECAFNAVPWERLYHDDLLLYTLLDALYYVTDGLVVLMLGLPLLYGCAMIFEGAARGVRKPMATLFCAFTSARAYRRALGVILCLLGFPLLALSACAGVAWMCFDAIDASTLYTTIPLSLLFLAFMAVMLGQNDAVLALAYDDPDATVLSLLARSRKMTKGRLLDLLRFKLAFLGWGLLSVLSLGLVLIFHALPMFSLSYSLLLTQEAGEDIS